MGISKERFIKSINYRWENIALCFVKIRWGFEIESKRFLFNGNANASSYMLPMLTTTKKDFDLRS